MDKTTSASARLISDKRGAAVKTMCNTPPLFKGTISVADCMFLSSLLKTITVWTVVQTVLTATFNSNGNKQISTAYKIDTPELINKKSRHSWLCPREDPLYQIWYNSTHWGLLDEYVKCNKKLFLFIPIFSGSRIGQTRGWLFTRDSSKDVKSHKDVPFGGLSDFPLSFGVKHPKTKILGAWIGLE